MTRARDVADHGWHLSPKLVAEQELAGINLFTTPFEWDIEANTNYAASITNITAWTGVSSTTYLRLRIGNASGVISDVYRFGGVISSQAPLSYINAFTTNQPGWLLCGLIAGNAGAVQSSYIDLSVGTPTVDQCSFQTRNHSYIYTGAGNTTEHFSGHCIGSSADATKAIISCEQSGVIPQGLIQVYKLPKMTS